MDKHGSRNNDDKCNVVPTRCSIYGKSAPYAVDDFPHKNLCCWYANCLIEGKNLL